MKGGEQRGSGAQRNGVSNDMEGGKGKNRTRTLVKGKKKRGRKEAATRANRFREAEGYMRRGKETMDDGENSRKVMGRAGLGHW